VEKHLSTIDIEEHMQGSAKHASRFVIISRLQRRAGVLVIDLRTDKAGGTDETKNPVRT